MTVTTSQQQQPLNQRCSCGSVPIIDITPITSSSSSSSIPNKEREKIKQACQTHGYFFIQVSKHTSLKNLNIFFHNNTDEMITRLFQERETIPNNNKEGIIKYQTDKDEIVYRSPLSESGNPNSTSHEPKQSFELFRCRQQKDDETKIKCTMNIMREWVEAFHTLSIIVSNVLLQLPDNFIVSSNCSCYSYNKKHQCNLDLLRIFRYDAVENEQLGSSPHTDWGTFTIIWQHTSKALQTYCPKHDIWNTVIFPETTSDYQCFLIHIGDFTSLATHSYFTSPRHRVRCSNTARNSLVYFVYPHLDVTLKNAAQIEMNMGEKDNFNLDTMYSLLQNQSSCGDCNDSKQLCWNDICDVPFGSVIEEKWKQVQRKS